MCLVKMRSVQQQKRRINDRRLWAVLVGVIEGFQGKERKELEIFVEEDRLA